MTADQRLDQLEPIISEAVTVLDRHTAQLKRLNNAVITLTDSVTTLTNSVIKQSDNITFLLTETVLIKDRLTNVESDVATLKGDVAEIKQGQQAMQAEFGGKLDLILAKIK